MDISSSCTATASQATIRHWTDDNPRLGPYQGTRVVPKVHVPLFPKGKKNRKWFSSANRTIYKILSDPTHSLKLRYNENYRCDIRRRMKYRLNLIGSRLSKSLYKAIIKLTNSSWNYFWLLLRQKREPVLPVQDDLGPHPSLPDAIDIRDMGPIPVPSTQNDSVFTWKFPDITRKRVPLDFPVYTAPKPDPPRNIEEENLERSERVKRSILHLASIDFSKGEKKKANFIDLNSWNIPTRNIFQKEDDTIVPTIVESTNYCTDMILYHKPWTLSKVPYNKNKVMYTLSGAEVTIVDYDKLPRRKKQTVDPSVAAGLAEIARGAMYFGNVQSGTRYLTIDYK